MKKAELKIKWKEQHKCYNCGVKLPEEDPRIRCKKCRGFNSKYAKRNSKETNAYNRGYRAGKKQILNAIQKVLK